MINKEKNKLIQITIPVEDAENLENLRLAYEHNGIKCTKSQILLLAFREYLKVLIVMGSDNNKEDK